MSASTPVGRPRPKAPPRGEGKATPARSVAEEELARAQAGRSVVQDFTPLADSLEWRLGQEYLRLRGSRAFLGDASPVPFVVNNDGSLSRNAAEVFFTSLETSEKEDGPLEEDLFVLELGIGVGLFARYFLDAFRQLCQERGKDYYDRLTYVAADRSERMLLDACRHGVFAEHPGRYRLRLVDALDPAAHLPGDLMFVGRQGPPLRAVFLNYLLDCLPAAVLELDGGQARQLCVRTCVARNVHLPDHTDLSVQALADRAKAMDAKAQRELLEVYGLFASEYDYRPVDLDQVPYGRFAADFARGRAKRIMHSWGAIRCLEGLLGLLHPSGFVLMNEYGQTQLGMDDDFEHQRFSFATAVGLNFPQLRAYFGEAGRCRWAEPHSEAGGIHARLAGRSPSLETRLQFQDRFGKARHDALHEPIDKARECTKVGRFELAATYYRQALALQPWNWVLLNEVSLFLTFSLREVKAGVELARAGLRQNPACSADLWCTLGDGLFEWGRVEEARSAYRKALAVSESDVRARYSLAWAYQRERDYEAALRVIAEALALDRRGDYRERLLQKQQEVLGGLAARHRQEYLLLINLVSKYAKAGETAKPTAEAVAAVHAEAGAEGRDLRGTEVGGGA